MTVDTPDFKDWIVNFSFPHFHGRGTVNGEANIMVVALKHPTEIKLKRQYKLGCLFLVLSFLLTGFVTPFFCILTTKVKRIGNNVLNCFNLLSYHLVN